MKYNIVIKRFRNDNNSKDGEWEFEVNSFDSAIALLKKLNDLCEHEYHTFTYTINEIGGDR